VLFRCRAQESVGDLKELRDFTTEFLRVNARTLDPYFVGCLELPEKK
jgi:hypothetical protein